MRKSLLFSGVVSEEAEEEAGPPRAKQSYSAQAAFAYLILVRGLCRKRVGAVAI